MMIAVGLPEPPRRSLLGGLDDERYFCRRIYILQLAAELSPPHLLMPWAARSRPRRLGLAALDGSSFSASILMPLMH